MEIAFSAVPTEFDEMHRYRLLSSLPRTKSNVFEWNSLSTEPDEVNLKVRKHLEIFIPLDQLASTLPESDNFCQMTTGEGTPTLSHLTCTLLSRDATMSDRSLVIFGLTRQIQDVRQKGRKSNRPFQQQQEIITIEMQFCLFLVFAVFVRAGAAVNAQVPDR